MFNLISQVILPGRSVPVAFARSVCSCTRLFHIAMAKAGIAAKAKKTLRAAPQEQKQHQTLVKKLQQTIRRMRHAKKKQVAELKEEIGFLEVCLQWYYHLIPEETRHMVRAEAEGSELSDG